MNGEAERLVRDLALEPHPEGGYYREIFRSPQIVVTARGDRRSALTVIYFLLAESQVSAWHRLRSDETWHFACGNELEISVLDDAGKATTLSLGPAGPYVAAIPAGQELSIGYFSLPNGGGVHISLVPGNAPLTCTSTPPAPPRHGAGATR